MKIIKQTGIIFTVCWVSVAVEKVLPFTFPASVIGMILLFLCLVTGVLKLEHIQEKADFLLSNMSFFFIPAGVSVINYFYLYCFNSYYLCSDCLDGKMDRTLVREKKNGRTGH